jgi:hypothetical protein
MGTMIAEVSGHPTYVTLENTPYRILTSAEPLFLFTICTSGNLMVPKHES